MKCLVCFFLFSLEEKKCAKTKGSREAQQLVDFVLDVLDNSIFARVMLSRIFGITIAQN